MSEPTRSEPTRSEPTRSEPTGSGSTAPAAPSAQVPNYWDYLGLDRLLALQSGLEGPEDVAEPDELLFIITHQAYELWFKQVLRELRLAIRHLGDGILAEEEVPLVVHHLRRVATIMRLAVGQFEVMETLTPQDFLGFRDKLVPASGFQSFQMREMEILLGLEDEQREKYGETDALEHIKALAERSPAGALAWGQISKAREEAAEGRTLRATLYRWLSRTPIEASSPDSPGDSGVVDGFLARYQAAYSAWQQSQKERLASAGITTGEELDKRFARTSEAARRFLRAEDLPEDQRAERRRARAGLLFIESHRSLPLLAWPRVLIDAVVEVEEQFVLFRHRHARMVERVIGRRVGTGGSSGVEYLDRTTRARVFGDLWAVRTLQMPARALPAVDNARFYAFATPPRPAD